MKIFLPKCIGAHFIQMGLLFLGMPFQAFERLREDPMGMGESLLEHLLPLLFAICPNEFFCSIEVNDPWKAGERPSV